MAAVSAGLLWSSALPQSDAWGQSSNRDSALARTASVHADSALTQLIDDAIRVSPAIRAGEARARSARARIGPAGTRPDPTLMAGVTNLPLSRPSFTADEMTMKMVGLGQTIPYPGKLGARRRVIELEAEAVTLALDTTRLAVARDVKTAYYELAYVDRALDIVKRNAKVMTEFVIATEAHYNVGTGTQQDVLQARVAAAQLGERANALVEQRVATLAVLNAQLDRPSDTPVEAAFPARLDRAAMANATAIHFVGNTLGAPAADSPLPSLQVLQSLAVEKSPMLRAHEQLMTAQTARIALAQKAYKPDLDVSLQYGQRTGRPDMVTAQVSIPLRIHSGAIQDQQLAEARADLDQLEAEHRTQVNEVRVDVARAYASVDRARTQLALYVRAIIPQGQASLASATAGYQVGKVGVLTLLDSQTNLFTYETAYCRALADLGMALAQLEQIVGQELIQ